MGHHAPGDPGAHEPAQGVEDLPKVVDALAGVGGQEGQVRGAEQAYSSSLTSLGYGFRDGFRCGMPTCYRSPFDGS